MKLFKKSTVLTELQTWYAAHADALWLEDFGIEIQSQEDDASWHVKINLSNTWQQEEAFEGVEYSKDDDCDWLQCNVSDNVFHGHGDSSKLEQIIEIFIAWAKADKHWLSPLPPMTQEDKDKEWYESLGEELGPEHCRNSGCTNLRIEKSVMCRRHHFEMLRKYPFPEENN